jgi:purine-cytosine permease-like protein
VPFLDQTLYVGPMVKVLGGADISWIVGFVVAGAGYLIATRVAGGGAVSQQEGVSPATASP